MFCSDSEDEFDQYLCLNYDLKKLLWYDELNLWVRCAFGNVLTKFRQLDNTPYTL